MKLIAAFFKILSLQDFKLENTYNRETVQPSITDGVHRNENFEETIPVFSTSSNFFKQKKKKNYSNFM